MTKHRAKTGIRGTTSSVAVLLAITAIACDAREDEATGTSKQAWGRHGGHGFFGKKHPHKWHRDGRGHDKPGKDQCPEDPAEQPSEPCPWTPYSEGLVGGAVNHVAFDPFASERGYAFAGGYVFASVDAGQSWTKAVQAPSINDVAFTDELVLASSSDGLLAAPRDNPTEWESRGLSGLSLGPVFVHPAEPLRVFAGAADGVLRSINGGKTWRFANNGMPRGLVSDIVGHPTDIDVLAVSGIFLNPEGGWSMDGFAAVSLDGARSWTTTTTEFGRTHGLHWCESSTLFGATRTGVIRSTDGGQTWDLVYAGETRAIGGHSASCAVVYANPYEEGIVRTADGGNTWSEPLTAGFVMPSRASGFQIAVHPEDPDIVIAAGATGAFQFSRSESGAWDALDDVGVHAFQAVLQSPSNPAKLWLSTFGHGVWQRHAPAATWERIPRTEFRDDFVYGLFEHPNDTSVLVGGWPALYRRAPGASAFEPVDTGNVFDMQAHPNDPNRILAGTQTRGVLLSNDGGQSWVQQNEGLSPWDTPAGTFIDVRAVAVDPLRPAMDMIGTEGKGVYEREAERAWSVVAPEVFGDQWVSTLDAIGDRMVAVVANRGVAIRNDDLEWSYVNHGLPSLAPQLVWDEASDALIASVGRDLFRLPAGASTWEPFLPSCLPGGGPLAIFGPPSDRRIAIAVRAAGIFTAPLP